MGLSNLVASGRLGDSGFIKVFTGLFLAYIFYDSIIKQFNFNINLLFKWYLYGAVIVSIIGLFQFISYQIGFYKGYDFCYRQHGGNISSISKVMTYENELIKKNFTDVKRHAEFIESFKKISLAKMFNMNRYDLYLISLKFFRVVLARIYTMKLIILRHFRLNNFDALLNLK